MDREQLHILDNLLDELCEQYHLYTWNADNSYLATYDAVIKYVEELIESA